MFIILLTSDLLILMGSYIYMHLQLYQYTTCIYYQYFNKGINKTTTMLGNRLLFRR